MSELNFTAIASALAIENEKNEGSRFFDHRRSNGKGENRYASMLADPQIFAQIKIALDRGASKNSLFRGLRDEGFLDDNSSYEAFSRALNRAIEQRENPRVRKRKKEDKSSSKIQPSRVATAAATTVFTPESKGSATEGVEYERDGKRFTVLKGVEREVPEGHHVLRMAIVPKLVIEEPPDDDEFLDSSKLPGYIKESMEASLQNGTAIEDAKKHEQMIDEWKAQKKLEKQKVKGVKPNETRCDEQKEDTERTLGKMLIAKWKL